MTLYHDIMMLSWNQELGQIWWKVKVTKKITMMKAGMILTTMVMYDEDDDPVVGFANWNDVLHGQFYLFSSRIMIIMLCLPAMFVWYYEIRIFFSGVLFVGKRWTQTVQSASIFAQDCHHMNNVNHKDPLKCEHKRFVWRDSFHN